MLRSGADPVTVQIVTPYDDWIPGLDGLLVAEGYCHPDSITEDDVRAEIHFWDPGLGGLRVIHGQRASADSPCHWKAKFDPVGDPLLPADTWVSLVVFCRHPDTGNNDIGQDCVTVYCKAAMLRKAKLAAAMLKKKGKKSGK